MHITYVLSYLSICVVALVCCLLYNKLTRPLKIFTQAMFLTFANELISYLAGIYKVYSIRYVANHICDIVLLCIVTSYFLSLQPTRNQNALSLSNLIFWPLLGLINILFFQPITQLNSNILILQCFWFISLSLNLIYITIKNDVVENILSYTHFQICVIWLLLWSSSLFFWAFLKVLYRGNWEFMTTALHVKALINCFCYLGLAFVMYKSGKTKLYHGTK